jgi:hypothetical protein
MESLADAVCLELTRRAGRLTLSSMESKRKTILLVVVSILAVLVIGLFFAFWDPTPPPAVKMPMPNGYTAFVQAGAMVQKQTGDFEKMSVVDLTSLVEANSNALQTARLGLGEKSRVPLPLDLYASVDASELNKMRMLTFAFFAEGQLAELEKRTNDAARAYFDAARLGIDSRQGGPLIDNLVGIADESMGTARLQKLVPYLDAKTSADLARQLEAASADQESWPQILQNEKSWTRQTFPGLRFRIAEIITSAELKAAREKGRKKYETQQAKTHRLILDLAAHGYQLDKGHRPTNVTELVPDYLKAAPIDPLTGKEMTLTP